MSKGVEFLQLDADCLAALLKDDGINVTSEEEVFNALMRWVKYDYESHKPSLGTLSECVRFKHVSESVRKLISFIRASRCLIFLFPVLVLVEGDSSSMR